MAYPGTPPLFNSVVAQVRAAKGVGFGRRPFLCDVAHRSQRSPMEAPVLPEPGPLYVRTWRASHSSRHRIELTSVQHLRTCGQSRPTDLDGEMDTKPKDAKPADLDLELAVFAAP
jgi:hypothetical protein